MDLKTGSGGVRCSAVNSTFSTTSMPLRCQIHRNPHHIYATCAIMASSIGDVSRAKSSDQLASSHSLQCGPSATGRSACTWFESHGVPTPKAHSSLPTCRRPCGTVITVGMLWQSNVCARHPTRRVIVRICRPLRAQRAHIRGPRICVCALCILPYGGLEAAASSAAS